MKRRAYVYAGAAFVAALVLAIAFRTASVKAPEGAPEISAATNTVNVSPTLFLTETPTVVITDTPTPLPLPTPTPTPSPTSTPSPTATKTPTPTPTVPPAVDIPPPSGRLAGRIIGLDPGHQRKGDSGQEAVAPGSSQTKPKVSSGATGVATGTLENVINLNVALKLRDLLEAEGATVVMTRTTADVNISNQQRAILMNDRGVELCLRIHCNGSSDPTVRGAMMFLPGHSTSSAINETSAAYGRVIHKAFVERTGLRNAGTTTVTDLTGFNWSTVPVCLTEMGFLSNAEDDRLLASAEFQSTCAQGLFEGICAALG